MELWEQREAWEEQEAARWTKTAISFREMGTEYQSRPGVYHAQMAVTCFTKAEAFDTVASSLRQPRNMRLELEDYQRLTKRD